MSGNQPGCSKPVRKRKRKSELEILDEKFENFEANLRVAVRQECANLLGSMVPNLVKYLQDNVNVPPATTSQRSPTLVGTKSKEIDGSNASASVAAKLSLGYNSTDAPEETPPPPSPKLAVKDVVAASTMIKPTPTLAALEKRPPSPPKSASKAIMAASTVIKPTPKIGRAHV